MARSKAFKFDKHRPHSFLAALPGDRRDGTPKGPEAIEALKMTLQTSYGPKPGTALETRAKAVKILRDYYVAKPVDQGLARHADRLSTTTIPRHWSPK